MIPFIQIRLSIIKELFDIDINIDKKKEIEIIPLKSKRVENNGFSLLHFEFNIFSNFLL